MRRAIPVGALVAMLAASGCLPAVAGGMVVAGGASLYAAKVAHGDCSHPDGSAAVRACVWVDLLFALPLFALGTSLTLTGVGLGVYSVTCDR